MLIILCHWLEGLFYLQQKNGGWKLKNLKGPESSVNKVKEVKEECEEKVTIYSVLKNSHLEGIKTTIPVLL